MPGSHFHHPLASYCHTQTVSKSEGSNHLTRANYRLRKLGYSSPVYTIHRPRRDHSQVANMSQDDILQTLLDNRVPPEWVDHAYSYGVTFLNGHYGDGWIDGDLMDSIDNERIARLRRYGEPRAIMAWGGWQHSTSEEVQALHATMVEEALRSRTATYGAECTWVAISGPEWIGRVPGAAATTASGRRGIPTNPWRRAPQIC